MQARADEEQLRARSEATKANEATEAAKRLESELEQLRGIGSQAQPTFPPSVPPVLLCPSTFRISLLNCSHLPTLPPSLLFPQPPTPSAQRELQGERGEATRAHRALEEARASHGSEAERWAARERHLQAEREQMQQDLALSQASQRPDPSDRAPRPRSPPPPPYHGICPQHNPPAPPPPPRAAFSSCRRESSSCSSTISSS